MISVVIDLKMGLGSHTDARYEWDDKYLQQVMNETTNICNRLWMRRRGLKIEIFATGRGGLEMKEKIFVSRINRNGNRRRNIKDENICIRKQQEEQQHCQVKNNKKEKKKQQHLQISVAMQSNSLLLNPFWSNWYLCWLRKLPENEQPDKTSKGSDVKIVLSLLSACHKQWLILMLHL